MQQETTTEAQYENDIPMGIAIQAHYNTSHVPEKRARQVRADYAVTLKEDREYLERFAKTPKKQQILEEEFSRYRSGLRSRFIARLQAQSRTASPMVTGPANFPTRRNQKAMDAERGRLEDLETFRERALKAIKKKLTPELQPVKAGDDDAVERLEAKIARAEENQDLMKKVNAAYRKGGWEGVRDAGLLTDEQTASLQGRAVFHKNEKPFPPYALQNNNANIRRMKERLEKIKTAKETPREEVEGENATFEDDPAANRVRLFYPGKPSAEIRSRLKSAGFRWAPSLGAWQAYRNPVTIRKAREEAGVSE